MGYTVEHWTKGGKYQEVRDYDDAMKAHLEGNGWTKVTTRDDWSPFVEKKRLQKKLLKKQQQSRVMHIELSQRKLILI